MSPLFIINLPGDEHKTANGNNKRKSNLSVNQTANTEAICLRPFDFLAY